jgi:hypothetical protein
MPPSTLIIYLKTPREGYVKTRLAKSIGPEGALKAYRKLVARQLKEIPSSVQIFIDFTPADAGPEFRQWLGDVHKYRPQIDGDLGQKLSHSTATAFQQGAEICICIGGDCPGLSERHILEASKALEQGADLVVGPCEDGGYYLIGIKEPRAELFEGIPWSAPTTLKVTLEKAAEKNLKVQQLETLYDVDDIYSLQRAISAGYLPE